MNPMNSTEQPCTNVHHDQVNCGLASLPRGAWCANCANSSSLSKDRYYVWPSDGGYAIQDRYASRILATSSNADDAANIAFCLNHTHRNQ